jgi:leucyl aminopeptidase
VALGPQLAPFYTNQDATSEILMQAGKNSLDPLWRLPFWEGYEPMIEPGIADLDNAPAGGFAGSITAALFLRRFVAEADKYIHFDIYGWAPKAAAGITKGGTSQGIRALASALPKLLSL